MSEKEETMSRKKNKKKKPENTTLVIEWGNKRKSLTPKQRRIMEELDARLELAEKRDRRILVGYNTVNR